LLRKAVFKTRQADYPWPSSNTGKTGAGMTSAISEKIIEIIAQQALLDVGDVTPDANLETLGLDSLGLVETIFAIEEAFDISIPFNANDPKQGDFDVSSVATVIAAVERLVAEQRA
jgi:acyl carrier protein